ncbi:hypothetical protein ACROYT_G026607 [Oculina patagonica]
MLFAVSFLLFGACVVSSNPVKNSYPIQGTTDLESQDNMEFQEDSLIWNERRARQCTHGGEEYVRGTILNITVEVSEDQYRCDRCKCIRGKFRKCTPVLYCDQQCDEYEFLPGKCCPECKREGCGDDREVGDQWQQIKSLSGPNKGICSLCECGADRKEYCNDDQFECVDIPGCQETERKPDFCCPQCKTWASSTTTTQPWFTIQITTEEATQSTTEETTEGTQATISYSEDEEI